MNKSNITPVAVKPAITKTTPTAVKAQTSNRPVEKILSRVQEMNDKKTVHWLSKTSRTIVNHYDLTAKKRKCTEAYWDGLMARYESLSEHAKSLKAWDAYCKSINKSENHTGITFVS